MNNTYLLINSLSTSEKRKISNYLKKSSNSQVQYTLYKILLSKKKYDKQKIATHLANKITFKSNYDSVEYELQKSILTYLRIISKNSTIRYQISELIDLSDILKNKGLYDLSLKKIREGIKLSIDTGDNYSLLQLYKIKKSIDTHLTNSPEKELYTKMEECLDLTSLELRYDYNFHRMNELALELHLHNKKKNLSKIESIIKAPLYKRKPSGIINQNLYFATISMYYEIVGDFKKSYSIELETLKAIKNHPKIIKEKLLGYTNILSSLHSKAIRYKQETTAKELSNEIKDLMLKAKSKSINQESSRIVFAFFLAELRNAKFNLSSLNINEDEMENTFNLYKHYVHNIYLAGTIHEMSYYYFTRADYKNAHKWLSKLYIENNDYDGQNSYVMAVLSYLIHFELGNDDLLEKIRNRIIEQLSELKESSSFDKLLGGFFSSNKNIEKVLSNNTLLNDNIIKLKLAIKDTPQIQILNDVNIIAWLISKRDNISFMEALKRYNKEY